MNLAPAEFSNWQEARTSLIAEKKSGMKAQLEAELSSLADDSGLEKIRSRYTDMERSLEHGVDHAVHTFSAILDLEYKCAFVYFCSNCICMIAMLPLFLLLRFADLCACMRVQFSWKLDNGLEWVDDDVIQE